MEQRKAKAWGMGVYVSVWRSGDDERLYHFARASLTKCHTLGGSNSRNLLCHNSGGWKSKVQGHAPLEGSREESVPCLSPHLWEFFGLSQPLCPNFPF